MLPRAFRWFHSISIKFGLSGYNQVACFSSCGSGVLIALFLPGTFLMYCSRCIAWIHSYHSHELRVLYFNIKTFFVSLLRNLQNIFHTINQNHTFQGSYKLILDCHFLVRDGVGQFHFVVMSYGNVTNGNWKLFAFGSFKRFLKPNLIC